MSDTSIIKEVESTNKQVMGLQETASALTIKSPTDLQVAEDILGSIKSAEKAITTRKEEITRPLMQGLASVRDMFKPLELTLDSVKKLTKSKVLAYQTMDDERIAMEKAKIEQRLAAGTIRADTALKKFGEIAEAPKSRLQTRTLTKVRIMDETLIPREYMVPDMPKITEMVLKQGIDIMGVEKYQEKIIAN